MVATDAIFFFGQPVLQQHGHSPPANFCRAQRQSVNKPGCSVFADSCLFSLHPNGARPAQHRCLEVSGQSTPSIGSGSWFMPLSGSTSFAWVVRSSKARLMPPSEAGRSGSSSSKGHRRRGGRCTCGELFRSTQVYPPFINGLLGSPTSKNRRSSSDPLTSCINRSRTRI